MTSRTQDHKIRIREISVFDEEGPLEKRFSAIDLLSGVGAGGDTEEDARKRLMRHYDDHPDKLPDTDRLPKPDEK